MSWGKKAKEKPGSTLIRARVGQESMTRYATALSQPSMPNTLLVHISVESEAVHTSNPTLATLTYSCSTWPIDGVDPALFHHVKAKLFDSGIITFIGEGCTLELGERWMDGRQCKRPPWSNCCWFRIPGTYVKAGGLDSKVLGVYRMTSG